jgi:hypothetical protein
MLGKASVVVERYEAVLDRRPPGAPQRAGRNTQRERG